MLFRWAILVWWNLLPLSARLARINGSSMIGFQRRKRRRQFVNLLYFLSFRPILARINGSSIIGFQRRKRGCQFVNLFYFLSFLLTLILLDIEFIVLNKLSLLTLLYLKLKNKDIILKKMTGIIRMFRGSQGINIGGDQHFFTTSTASFASSPAADTSPASYAATTTQHSVPPNSRRPSVPPRKFRPLSTMAERGRARHPDYPIERLRNVFTRLHASRHLGPRTHTLDSPSQLLPPLHHLGHTSSNDRRQFLHHRRTPPV